MPEVVRVRLPNLHEVGWVVVVLLYLFGYCGWSDPYDRADMDYVFSGAVAFVLFTYAAMNHPSSFVKIGLVVGAFEAFQKAACGTTWSGPSAENICVAQYRQTPYVVVALISSFYIGTRQWKYRKWLTRTSLSGLARSFRQRLKWLISRQ